VGELDELETFVGSKKAARPRAAERRKGILAKTTKSGFGQPMLGYSIRLLIHYLKFQEVPIPYGFIS
jgi:hypothetical protein